MTKDEIRDIRRHISGWLTDQINDLTSINEKDIGKITAFDFFRDLVREKVFEVLNTITTELKAIDKNIIEKHTLRADTPITRFYMKGGNAFRFNMKMDGFGTSDWDTQILINPWLPKPVINDTYALIEDLVVQLFKTVSDDISELNEAFLRVSSLETTIQSRWQDYLASLNTRSTSTLPKDALNPVENAIHIAKYTLKLDNSQSIRKVFPHQPNGLWLNTGQPIKTNTHGPSIILNNAIKPFVLYRLGYVWHAQTSTPAHEVNSAILMELIDVTIPRKQTVEAISSWEEIKSDEIIMGEVRAINKPTLIHLPFPNNVYHAREQLIMLCEIADGSSKHASKMKKRFDRFAQVWKQNQDASALGPIQTLVTTLNGQPIPDPLLTKTSAPHPRQDTVAKLESVIGKEALKRINIPDYKDESYKPYYYAVNLMFNVKKRSTSKVSEAHRNYNKAKTSLTSIDRTLIAAISDDDTFAQDISQSDYFDVCNLPMSNIAGMLFVRVSNKSAIDDISNQFIQYYSAPLKPIRSTELKIVGHTMPLQPKAASKRGSHRPVLMQSSTDEYNVVSLDHNKEQDTRISYARTIILSDKTGKIALCITFTNANNTECPFEPDPRNKLLSYVNLAFMAEQRRIVASLIHDYVTRTALSKQIDMIDSLIQTR
jgi:hypothetical protein